MIPSKFPWRAAARFVPAMLLALAGCQAEPAGTATPDEVPPARQVEGADLSGSPGGMPDGTGAGNATRSSGTGTGLSGSGLMSGSQ